MLSRWLSYSDDIQINYFRNHNQPYTINVLCCLSLKFMFKNCWDSTEKTNFIHIRQMFHIMAHSVVRADTFGYFSIGLCLQNFQTFTIKTWHSFLEKSFKFLQIIFFHFIVIKLYSLKRTSTEQQIGIKKRLKGLISSQSRPNQLI